MARLAVALGRRPPARPADALCGRRRPRSHRIRDTVACGVRRIEAGPGRQRGIGAIAARRVRRVDRLAVPRAARGVANEAWTTGDSSAPLEFLEKAWSEPDHGIWETRGEKRHFTHSKVMAWAAFDRALGRHEGVRASGAGSALDEAARSHPCRGVRARDSTASATRSCSPTAARKSTRACCCCRKWDSCRRETLASRAPLPRSSTTSWSADSSCAIARCRHSRTSLRTKGAFLRVRSGSPTLICCADARRPPKAVQAPAPPVQRRRPARRAVRPCEANDARQLSAGVVAHGARQHRAQPVAAGRSGRGAQRTRLQTPRPLSASVLVRP